MSIIPLKDLLADMRNLEVSAQSFFSSVAADTTDPGARLIASYLARHSHHLSDALVLIDKDALVTVEAFTVMVSESQIPDSKFFTGRRLDASSSADSLLDLAIAYSGIFLDAYEKVLTEAQTGEARDFFSTLRVIEKRTLKELKKIRAMHYF